MIEANEFLSAARARGFDFYAGVPCSFLTAMINRVISDRSLDYVGAASEGEAVAIASGAWLAGRRWSCANCLRPMCLQRKPSNPNRPASRRWLRTTPSKPKLRPRRTSMMMRRSTLRFRLPIRRCGEWRQFKSMSRLGCRQRLPPSSCVIRPCTACSTRFQNWPVWAFP